jgi:hypothetical protein
MGYGRNTYENFDVAERVLWSLTIRNLIDYRDEQLTHFFRRQMTDDGPRMAHDAATVVRRPSPLVGGPSLAPNERIVTDVSKVWALRRAAAQQMQDALALFSMGVPFNRIDTFLGLGVGEVPGGDVPHPFALRPVGDEGILSPGEG